MSVNCHLHGVSKPFRGVRALIIVFVLFALLALAASGFLASPTQAIVTASYSDEELSFLRLLNDYRLSSGRDPLLLSDTLSVATYRHSSDMGKYGFFSHRTGWNTEMTAALPGAKWSDWFDQGAYPWDRMKASGYDYATNMGENIAAGHSTGQDVFNGFKGSAAHNTAMLDSNYKVVGISQVYVSGTPYWTVDFGGYVDPSAHEAGLYPVLRRLQQDDPKLYYAGSWNAGWSSSASGGSFRHASSAGAAVNITFKGTYLAWLAKKSPVYGKAWVKLDGGAPVLVDLYSSTAKYQQQVYKTGLLEDKEHTLSIYWIGQKNRAARGYNINMDAFDLVGELTQAPAPEPLPYTYQNTDPRITYLGNWSTYRSGYASGGNYHYSGGKGNAALVRFTGTSVQLLAKKGPNYGKALICLDGVWESEPVDFYSPTAAFQQTVFSRAGLDAGAHSLIIKCLGEANPSAVGYFVDLDALRITGTMIQADRPMRLQQSDPKLYYAGYWTGGWNSRASGGSFRDTNSPGSTVTVTFDGTYLVWLATKSRAYGIAKVTLDDREPVYVDLYSRTSIYKQRAYTTGLLDSATHTLTIEWTGRKNPAAKSNYVNIDAFDMFGSPVAK